MKKKYSLDFSIESDVDRLKAIEKILDGLDSTPNSTDLEQMASYIMYGKGEDGLNEVQRGNIDDRETKRYHSYKTLDEKATSLDEIMDNPLADQMNLKPYDTKRTVSYPKPRIEHPKYNKKTGELIDPGDSLIPGMQELWENIKRLEHCYNANAGTVPYTDEDSVIVDQYRLWQFKHMIMDVRRHQYYLKDSFKPTIHFTALTIPSPQYYNFDSDTYYWVTREELEAKLAKNYNPQISNNPDDYETRWDRGTNQLMYKWVVMRQAFDWENPIHIRKLIDHYSDIYMQMRDKLDSWGRTLIYDFDRYFNMCEFTEVREYILLRKIDKASLDAIRKELLEKFGISYQTAAITSIINKEIPNAMANMAKKHSLMINTPRDCRKTCSVCGREIPAIPLFFIKNQTKKFGVESACKECAKKSRIRRGLQRERDTRKKENKKLLEMQAGKTNV